MRDCLLHIDTYSAPTEAAAIEQAVGFAGLIGARITGLAAHINISVPRNWLAEQLLDVSRLAQTEEEKSLRNAQLSLDILAKSASRSGVIQDGRICRSSLTGVGLSMAQSARTRDLSLICISSPADNARSVAEEVIFASGRPVLVFHPSRAPLPQHSLGCVVIAWDASRWAARAVNDALPVLRRAREVRILTVVGEKTSATAGLGADLVRHLQVHDIQAVVDEAPAQGRTVGASFDAYCEQRKPDLMVMGAYGSSRLKEFFLGGATEHILNEGRIAALLSH